MKLLTYTIAGRDRAKKCKSLDDAIKLCEWVIDNLKPDVTDDLKNTLIMELQWLTSNDYPIFINDISKLQVHDQSADPDIFYEPYCIRVFNGDSYNTVVPQYGVDNTKYIISSHKITKGSVSTKIIGGFYINKTETFVTKETIYKEYCDKLIIFYRGLICGLINNNVLLKEVTRKPVVKNGKITIKSTVQTYVREPSLTASFHRTNHTRTLRAPRYYPNGEVPKDESKLRVIEVSETEVHRDIKKYKAVNKDANDPRTTTTVH